MSAKNHFLFINQIVYFPLGLKITNIEPILCDGDFSKQNLLIQEIELDDVPWRDKIISEPLKIKDGYLELNDKPGYGVELNFDEIRKPPPKY